MTTLRRSHLTKTVDMVDQTLSTAKAGQFAADPAPEEVETTRGL
jgi:hypothetical protein